MDFINASMIAEIGAFGGSAVDDAQEARLDERFERLFDDGADVGIDWITLENHHLIFHQQLRENIGWPNAGDVSSTQDQRDLARMLLILIDRGLGFGQFLCCYARFHPDFSPHAAEEEFV